MRGAAADDLAPAAVKALRLRLGLTQAAFAARLGATSQAVSYWERGTRAPTGLYARALRQLAAEAEAAPKPAAPDKGRSSR